ncbi:MAG: SUMF1/EgtB/PvdO family nonheme iron enzyme [Flavobacteriales bacterium]|nr:SUMF1/EgtB/PvdO family nonheme iron enzyme [Flavobacteriales bacterium]
MRPLALLLCLASMYAHAQMGPKEIYYMERFSDSTFVDIIEVKVADWLAFMHHGGGPMPEAEALRRTPYAYLFSEHGNRPTRTLRLFSLFPNPESEVELRADSLRTGKQRKRAWNYAQYPITGITQEQAMAYCAWRTRNYADRMMNGRDSGYSVIYDLPTPDEFDMLLSPVDSLKGGCPTFNYNCLPCQAKAHASVRPGKEPVPSDSYLPDSVGLYQLHGNVAEMTSIPGIAMGGSYQDPARECAPGRKQPYTKPEPWLGFRCVARVKAR